MKLYLIFSKEKNKMKLFFDTGCYRILYMILLGMNHFKSNGTLLDWKEVKIRWHYYIFQYGKNSSNLGAIRWLFN
jgi:hypothetical protein